ncbi:MAG: HAMP domain-containing sensor histidine kinase, partial [Litoreibacter sp.]
DLRTPLARLRSRLEMLPEGEERGAALEEAGRLSAIFDTIMRVARIEAAQGRIGFEAVALAPLVAELKDTFGPVVEDGGKVLKTQISGAATVQADRQMLIQAMANLIQNALVHGGDEITLIAEGHSIGVADNGPGVDPSHYDEIVKPMVRLDSARGSDGSGLGLALVRAVAQRHGAKLTLNPQRGEARGLCVLLNFADL